jgi:hypothetical protein
MGRHTKEKMSFVTLGGLRVARSSPLAHKQAPLLPYTAATPRPSVQLTAVNQGPRPGHGLVDMRVGRLGRSKDYRLLHSRLPSKQGKHIRLHQDKKAAGS